jgi:hypothetical protein
METGYEQVDDNTLRKIDFHEQTITKQQIQEKINKLQTEIDSIVPKTESDQECLDFWNATYADESLKEGLQNQLDLYETLLSIFEE